MPDLPDLERGISAGDLLDDKPLAGTVGGKPVVLVRHGGRVCALAGECTHLGAPLADGVVIDGELRCPWHHARFALSNGEAVAAPALEPLATYATIEEDGRIRVTGTHDDGDGDLKQTARDIGRVVIVGDGAAGHACADMLARRGAGAQVTLIGQERDAPYDRTLCSKAYLSGEKARDDCFLPEPGMGRGPAAELRKGCAVASIDPAAKAVVTADGERIGYDTLVLATGCDPVAPGFKGADVESVFTLRTLADADALIAAAEGAERVVVVGASFIALEVAASMVARDLSVTVVAPDTVPLQSVLGTDAGQFVQGKHEAKGVTFRLGRRIERYGDGCVTLNDGERLAADMVVVGIGVTPRTALAEEAGLETIREDEGGGVRVDGRLRTSDGSIHAIGDIACYPDVRLGHAIRVEHWAHAQHQGQYLARLLLGETEADYAAVPFFWSGHYDTQLRYVGHVGEPGSPRLDGSIDDGDFTLFYSEDGTEQAALSCGRDAQSLEIEARYERG